MTTRADGASGKAAQEGALRLHSDFSRRFLEYVQQRELRYARCDRCEGVLAYAERVCREHPRARLEWVRASGRATLHALATYRLAYSADQPTPYNVAVVELEEGPRLVSSVQAQDPGSLAVGMPLQAFFAGNGLLMFAPVPRCITGDATA